jgi:transcription initiation factor IIE alpha subunit
MVKRKGKGVSFDAMVKFFMQNYEIPTKKDVDKLMTKLDNIEKLLKSNQKLSGRSRVAAVGEGGGRKRPGTTAVEQVLAVMKGKAEGVSVAEIKDKTGFDDKKIRNILFRLYKSGNIRRVNRGVYTAQ